MLEHWVLADANEPNKVSIASAGGVKPLVLLLGGGNARAQMHAANALACLALGNVDNQPDGGCKIAVGSFSGMLRVYEPPVTLT